MNTINPNFEHIEGEITRIQRFDSGYTILTLKQGRDSVKLVGDMPGFAEGMNVLAKAEKTTHPRYGDQFKVVEIEEKGFVSSDAMINYLASNAFKGIGKAVARSIVNHFGVETFDILDQNPDRLFEVPGLPASKAQIVVETWLSERAAHKIRSELIKLGMSPVMAAKVHKHFGEQVLDFVTENPYCLTEVSGIGFFRADEIALKTGVPRNSPNRVEASLKYVLDQALMGGDCYLPLADLSEESIKLLKGDVNATHIMEAVRRMVSRGKLVNEKNRIFLSGIREAEKQVAEMLLSMTSYQSIPMYSDMDALRHDLMSIGITGQITLAPRQEEALFTAINSRVAIITGGPGVGKSTITRALCALFDRHQLEFKLAAPTGRAAKRLAEATESEASTIHRLLQFDPASQGFLYKQGNPLPTQVVIIDESSMMDILLFRHLLLAMESHMRLVIVGDKDQLPSVGPGNVLRDLIASKQVPCVKLDQIFRQAKGNTIIPVAHDILHGVAPELPSPAESKGRNCMMVVAEEQSMLIDHIIMLVTKSLPNAGFKPEDIQILTPMRARGLGIEDLNPRLQDALNPKSDAKAEVQSNSRTFRVGDRVMQIKNNYKKGDNGVFNGDIGTISAIIRDGEEVNIWVRYPDMPSPIDYAKDEWDELQHCWACTVHKSQGAEYPCVILVQHTSQFNMLQRNLIYTGVTRARKLCIIAGTRRAVEVAVNNDKEVIRNTTLSELMQNSLEH